MAKKSAVKKEEIQQDSKLEEIIIQALLEKKGEDIVCINLKGMQHVLFDYFIICTGNSKPHIETLSDFVQESTKRFLDIRPNHVEGLSNSEWVLLDYFNIIVHVFQPEAREFYRVEQLWNDAEFKRF